MLYVKVRHIHPIAEINLYQLLQSILFQRAFDKINDAGVVERNILRSDQLDGFLRDDTTDKG